jgi:hypothetical protein
VLVLVVLALGVLVELVLAVLAPVVLVLVVLVLPVLLVLALPEAGAVPLELVAGVEAGAERLSPRDSSACARACMMRLPPPAPCESPPPHAPCALWLEPVLAALPPAPTQLTGEPPT